MKNNKEEKRIIEMYKSVKTPEYKMKQAVLSNLNKQIAPLRANRKILLATVLGIILLLAGTVGAAAILENFKIFNFPFQNDQRGIIEQEVVPEPTILPENVAIIKSPIESEEIRQFLDSIQPYEIRAVYYMDGNGGGSGTMDIYHFKPQSYTEFVDIMSQGTISFPMPQYIPDGYDYDSAVIYLYLNESTLALEPDITVDESGVTRLVYQLPEVYKKHIGSYSLSYKNSDENYIKISAYIQPAFSEDISAGFGASASATAEKVKIKQFGDTMLIYDKEKVFKYLYKLVLYNEIEPIETADLLSMVMEMEREDEFSDETYIETMDAMLIAIDADNISRKDIIKIGENLN